MSKRLPLIEYKFDPKLQDTADILRRGEYQVLMIHGAFSQDRATKFEEDFTAACASGQPIIPILISSYGGSVDQLNKMIDIIETAPVPVATIAKGACMSCGALLLAAGTEGYRWASRGCSIMIHDITAGDFSKAEDILSDAKVLKKYRELIFHRLDAHTHKEKGHWMKTLKGRGNTDYYMTAAEAKRAKLIDFIGVPKLTVTATVDVTFE